MVIQSDWCVFAALTHGLKVHWPKKPICFCFLVFGFVFLTFFVSVHVFVRLPSVVCGCRWSPGQTGRSSRASRRTWGLGPPTTPSPPTRWWTPWGATPLSGTVDPPSLRLGRPLRKPFLMKRQNCGIKESGLSSLTLALALSRSLLFSNRKLDMSSCLITTAITCWWRLQRHTPWWREGPSGPKSEPHLTGFHNGATAWLKKMSHFVPPIPYSVAFFLQIFSEKLL